MKVLLTAVAGIAAVCVGCSGNDAAPAQTFAHATDTAPAGQLDRNTALAEVQVRFPALLSAINAVESEDEDAILEFLRWEEFECTPDDHRGGVGPRCSELDVPQGTLVPMFQYELLQTSYFTEEQMRGRIDDYLLGRDPELALIAAHPNGRWLISFLVDDVADDGLRAVDFRADKNGSAPFIRHTERFDASTPLDTIREDERSNRAAWEVIYASDALLAWDAE